MSATDTDVAAAILRLERDVGADVVVDLVEHFLIDSDGRISTMNKKLLSRAAPELRRDAHTLKGACLTFGGTVLGRTCQKLEHSVEGEHWDDAEQSLEEVAAAYTGLKAVLREYVRRMRNA